MQCTQWYKYQGVKNPYGGSISPYINLTSLKLDDTRRSQIILSLPPFVVKILKMLGKKVNLNQ